MISSLLTRLLESIPGPAKAGADILTVAGWVSVLAGALTQVIGLIAALLSLAWAALRLYEALTRRKHCANYSAACPKLCPPGCSYWRIKNKAAP